VKRSSLRGEHSLAADGRRASRRNSDNDDDRLQQATDNDSSYESSHSVLSDSDVTTDHAALASAQSMLVVSLSSAL